MAKDILITEQELAERWGLDLKTIARKRRAASDEVPIHITLNGSKQRPVIRYRLSDVEAFERARASGDTVEA